MKSPLTQWVILNIILFALGIGLGAGHYPVDFDGLRCPNYGDNSTLTECFQFGAFLGAITGFTIGSGQAVFLRKQFRWTLNQFIGWVVMTVIAFSFGHAIGDSAPIAQRLPFSAIAQGLLSGAILGGLQFLVLRDKVVKASRWVGYSTLGFGIGLGLVGIATMLMLDASRNSIFGWSGAVDIFIFIILDGLLVGGIWAVASGRVIFAEKAGTLD